MQTEFIANVKILLCITIISKTYSLILQGPYNILVKDNTVYNIGETFEEEEYEIVNKNVSTVISMGNNGSLLNMQRNKACDTLASSGLQLGNMKRGHIETDTSDNPLSTTVSKTKYWNYKKSRPAKYIYINNGTDYYFIPYDLLITKAESEDKLRNLTRRKDATNTNLMSTIKSLLIFDTHCKNCTAEELSRIGYKSIWCLVLDYRKGGAPRVLAARLWRIVKIWLLVSMCIALPLWCMKGWCCCCLCCKFFKPRQTIEEAKSYYLMNPPGVLTVNRKQIQYEPTEAEREAYEEFEHLLRTI